MDGKPGQVCSWLLGEAGEAKARRCFLRPKKEGYISCSDSYFCSKARVTSVTSVQVSGGRRPHRGMLCVVATAMWAVAFQEFLSPFWFWAGVSEICSAAPGRTRLAFGESGFMLILTQLLLEINLAFSKTRLQFKTYSQVG